MAPTQRKTDLPESGELSPSEVTDDRDVSPRAASDTSGKRVRAIPDRGATEIVVNASDFADNNIKHPAVVWNFRKDDFTVPVGDALSQEAADFLTKNHPHAFEYMNE